MKTLVLGGVKSGKSRYAEGLCDAENQPCTLIATATALDDEMAKRIERHKQDRPHSIQLIEEPILLGDAIDSVSENTGVLVDCLTLWLTNLLMVEDNSATLNLQKHRFLDALDNTKSRVVLVSNETNMGIMPLGDLTRRYCDEIGTLHQEIASRCDEVILMVAGLPLSVKTPKPSDLENT